MFPPHTAASTARNTWTYQQLLINTQQYSLSPSLIRCHQSLPTTPEPPLVKGERAARTLPSAPQLSPGSSSSWGEQEDGAGYGGGSGPKSLFSQ